MLVSNLLYDIKITLKTHFVREYINILPSFTQHYNGGHNVTLINL